MTRWVRAADILGLTIAALTLSGCGQENTYVAPPPPKVITAEAQAQPVTRYIELTGNTASINNVDLNARVQGYLTAINYKDGQFVKKGTVLFVIEQATYKANVEQAKATLVAKQAAQVQAEAEFNRQSQLARQEFASQAVLDQARAKRDSSVADTQGAQASLEQAQINLGYTQVTAPFDGIVTNHLQDVGALVGYGSPTKLASIVEVNQIYVWFTVSEQQVLRIKEDLARQGRGIPDVTAKTVNVPVEIGLQTEQGYPHKGRIDYIAPMVDPSLGTLTVRGVFDNGNDALLPGLFARVRVPLGQPAPLVLVNDTAIGVNQQGSYVLVVNAENVVEQRLVQPGPLQDGGLRAIEGGLKGGEKVVVNGLLRAVPGSKVAPEPGSMGQEAAASAQPAPAKK